MTDDRRCRFRYPWSLMDWNRAALSTGDYMMNPTATSVAVSQCIMDHPHDPAPHLVVNLWTGAVHAVSEGKNDRR